MVHWFVVPGMFYSIARTGTITMRPSYSVCFIFQKSGLKPPTSVGKDPTVRRRRSKPLNLSTLVGGGSVGSLYLLKQ